MATGDDGAVDVDDLAVDPLVFERCECETAVPDPVGYELPDETTVRLVACGECGGAVDWAVDGESAPQPAAVEEYRTLVRSLRGDIDALEAANAELRDELAADASEREAVLEDRVDGLEDGLADVRAERDRLQERVDELEAERAAVEAAANERARTPALGGLDRLSVPTIGTAVAVGLPFVLTALVVVGGLPLVLRSSRELTAAITTMQGQASMAAAGEVGVAGVALGAVLVVVVALARRLVPDR